MKTKEKLQTYNKSQVKDKRQELFEKGLRYYPGARLITDKTYKEIKKEFDAGDKSILNKLYEESLGNIIFYVADNYAKQNFEDFLPFEEGLSYTIERFLQYFQNYEYLVPTYRAKYIETILQYNVHRILTQKIDLMKAKKYNAEVVYETPKNITWIIDQIEGEEISMEAINSEEVRPKLEKMISKLREREQRALRLRFGLETGKQEPVEYICDQIGVSRSGLDRIIKMGLKRIRKQTGFDKIQEYSNTDLTV